MHFSSSTNQTINLKINGTHSKSVIYTGDLGGATITLKCHGVAITDGVLIANSQLELGHGVGAPIEAVITGITTPVSFFLYAMR
jgi:hypothetical protein